MMVYTFQITVKHPTKGLTEVPSDPDIMFTAFKIDKDVGTTLTVVVIGKVGGYPPVLKRVERLLKSNGYEIVVYPKVVTSRPEAFAGKVVF